MQEYISREINVMMRFDPSSLQFLMKYLYVTVLPQFYRWEMIVFNVKVYSIKYWLLSQIISNKILHTLKFIVSVVIIINGFVDYTISFTTIATKKEKKINKIFVFNNDDE